MQPFSLTIRAATLRYGIGRTTLYAWIRDGHIEALKAGARTLVLADSIERHIANLPRLPGADGEAPPR